MHSASMSAVKIIIANHKNRENKEVQSGKEEKDVLDLEIAHFTSQAYTTCKYTTLYHNFTILTIDEFKVSALAVSMVGHEVVTLCTVCLHLQHHDTRNCMRNKGIQNKKRQLAPTNIPRKNTIYTRIYLA